jgi:5-methyltetrahydrofolate--homocysteine methyltransferase
VLNSVFLHECATAGLDAAIVHASKILPLARIDQAARETSLDLVYDRRRDGYDPLSELLRIFDGVSLHDDSADDLADLPVRERLSRRIVDGNRTGLTDDLDAAMDEGLAPLEISRGCARWASSSRPARCSCPSCSRAPRP